MLNGINCAAVKYKIRELSDIGGVFVIYSVFAPICSPIGPIPYCGIQSHWLSREVTTQGFCSLELPNGNIVYIESTMNNPIKKHKLKSYLQNPNESLHWLYHYSYIASFILLGKVNIFSSNYHLIINISHKLLKKWRCVFGKLFCLSCNKKWLMWYKSEIGCQTFVREK